MSIITLSQLGRLEKEIEVNKELKLKLHTLSVSEQQKLLLDIPGDVDVLARYSYMQQATLFYATSEINGVVVSEENKNELKRFYSELQHTILVEIFEKYLQLVEEQTKLLEELKKK